MNKINHAAQNAWAEYCWMCDHTRIDEALALIGALTVAAAGFYVVSVLSSLAGCGASVLGVPVLLVARRAWSRRTR